MREADVSGRSVLAIHGMGSSRPYETGSTLQQ
jgi:hypothetical protein